MRALQQEASDLSLIPGTRVKADGENSYTKLSPDLHTWAMACVHSHHTPTTINNTSNLKIYMHVFLSGEGTGQSLVLKLERVLALSYISSP